MRQRSTLAHELGHVLFEDWVDSDTGDWSDRSPAEIRADAFARHLLVPVDGLREFIGTPSPAGLSTLSAVVQRFLVSPQIAAIALRQAGYIDETTKQEWMTLSAPQLAARFGWTDQYQVLQASSDRRRERIRPWLSGLTCANMAIGPPTDEPTSMLLGLRVSYNFEGRKL